MLIGWLFLIWSWTSARLAYPNGMSTTTRLLVRDGHAVLYALILIIPLSGYLTSTATGDGISIFGWAQLPTLAPLSAELRDAAILVHWMLAYALLIVVAGHAGAAIKHEWFDKDGTLRRMILGRVKPG